MAPWKYLTKLEILWAYTRCFFKASVVIALLMWVFFLIGNLFSGDIYGFLNSIPAVIPFVVIFPLFGFIFSFPAFVSGFFVTLFLVKAQRRRLVEWMLYAVMTGMFWLLVYEVLFTIPVLTFGGLMYFFFIVGGMLMGYFMWKYVCVDIPLEIEMLDAEIIRLEQDEEAAKLRDEVKKLEDIEMGL